MAFRRGDVVILSGPLSPASKNSNGDEPQLGTGVHTVMGVTQMGNMPLLMFSEDGPLYNAAFFSPSDSMSPPVDEPYSSMSWELQSLLEQLEQMSRIVETIDEHAHSKEAMDDIYAKYDLIRMALGRRIRYLEQKAGR